MMRELSFYNELNIVKTAKTFKRYSRSYSIEITDSEDPSFQLTVSKTSIKYMFKDLLDEIKGLKGYLCYKTIFLP